MFNFLVYTPTHAWGNLSAAYEYCNFYVYVVNLQLIFSLDLTFISEMVVRWAMVGSTELNPFINDMYELFNEPILNSYLVGFRWGMFWQLLWDVKLTS